MATPRALRSCQTRRRAAHGSHLRAPPHPRNTPDEIKGKRTTVSFLQSILIPQRVKTRGLGKVGLLPWATWLSCLSSPVSHLLARRFSRW